MFSKKLDDKTLVAMKHALALAILLDVDPKELVKTARDYKKLAEFSKEMAKAALDVDYEEMEEDERDNN